MIIIPTMIANPAPRDNAMSREWRFRRLDDGDVYNGLVPADAESTVPGVIRFVKAGHTSFPAAHEDADVRVRVVVTRPPVASTELQPTVEGHDSCIHGYVREGGRWHETDVHAVSVTAEAASGRRSILETDVLSDRRVFQVGLGSGGAPIAIELGRCGVQQYLLDHDRIEVGNISRHPAGLSDVGRFKTNYVAETIRDTNPSAVVHTSELKVAWNNEDEVRRFVTVADLVICAADDHAAASLLNKLCLEQQKPLILAGVFRRAHGGQVLRVRPGVSPCFECFRACLPDTAADREVSTPVQAARLAYTDRPVAVEPGLSSDIAPVSTMVVKLAIQELLRGQVTTLHSLNDDLVAPWYLWLNRRETGTDYEQLGPLGFEVDGVRVLRWYGIDLQRRPDCPACGDYLGELARQHRLTVLPGDVAEFADNDRSGGAND